MVLILDLSNELLHRIIQAIPRNDILSLSLTSKWFHVLCAKALKRHLTLKKYCTVSFGNYWGDFDRIHRSYNPKVHVDAKDAILLIEDMIRDPEIMEYPETMCLGNCRDVGDNRLEYEPWDNDEKEIRRKRQSVITHRYNELKEMVEDCEFIPEEEKETSFAALCYTGNEGVAVGLALTMLPNLKRIATQDWMRSYSSDRICPIIARIAEANQNPHSIAHNKALANLREFFMSHRDDEGGEDLTLFIPFAMLPSMRYLGGTEISAEYSYIPGLELRSNSSLVTEIELLESAISAEDFDELLCGILALRKFVYHYNNLVNFDCRYEVKGIVGLLRKYAASSLQHLDIVANFSDARSKDAERQQCVGFLSMFTALEVIRLEDVAFQVPSLDSDLNDESSGNGCSDAQQEGYSQEADDAQEEGYSQEADDAQEEDDAREEDDIEIEGDANQEDDFEEQDGAEEAVDVENESSLEQTTMNRLVDFLPVSVESLTLVQIVKDARRQELLCGLLKERSEKLPQLRILMYEGNDPVDAATIVAFEESGLIVDSRARSSESWAVEEPKAI
ncbi:MAG: hypothetical protein HETSPECPRED_008522 [Heterodermia speciosa]|uniref:F-box domain-containing protein n=1 Tax=Heterodermia speciosa TaxID=116794 RepID=A0A8H3IYN2_9LECA|nr:MAG: hypothetical protein HETSPECPRED_008522 [Heterodermia speciosa]